MRPRDKAKRLMRHYLYIVPNLQGAFLDQDCASEIEEIVDAIIEAAVEAARDEKQGVGK